MVTFGTPMGVARRVPFTPMGIVTIVSYATVIFPVALIGLLWRWSKRADKAKMQAQLPPGDSRERSQK